MGFYCVPRFCPTMESMKRDRPSERGSGGSSTRVATPFDLEKLDRQVIVEPYRSRGPGGQRKNKKETAIRLTHVPSGITVIATESRSQAANRQVAFDRPRKRLKELSRTRKRRVPTRPPAGAVRAQREEKKKLSERKRLRTRSGFSNKLD